MILNTMDNVSIFQFGDNFLEVHPTCRLSCVGSRGRSVPLHFLFVSTPPPPLFLFEIAISHRSFARRRAANGEPNGRALSLRGRRGVQTAISFALGGEEGNVRSKSCEHVVVLSGSPFRQSEVCLLFGFSHVITTAISFSQR